jgi:hypothetical protein
MFDSGQTIPIPDRRVCGGKFKSFVMKKELELQNGIRNAS